MGRLSVNGNGNGGDPQRRLPYSAYIDAKEAIEALMALDCYVPDTKAQFALRMGWVRKRSGGAQDEPDVDRVKDACTMTQDMAATGEFGGLVISYAPNWGGIMLIDPDSPMTGPAFFHLLYGDLQRQQATKTINSRRLPEWKAAGAAFANAGDHEMARLMWQAEGEIDRTGFVETGTGIAIVKHAKALGLI